MLDQAAESLRGSGCETMVEDRTILTRHEGFEAADEVRKGNPDGIVLFLGTWIECPVVMAAMYVFTLSIVCLLFRFFIIPA